MCGIFGYCLPKAQSFMQLSGIALLMQKQLHHRGPDDFGWHVYSRQGTLVGTEKSSLAESPSEGTLLLGQARLSIIDLTSAGHQPMRSADGRYTLVYNGEIYNYLEIRQELQQLGVTFLSQTDSEVLLYALAVWGTECLHRFTGMFAFAFYDSHTQQLLCARDAFGIKPLYWTRTEEGSFCFASELPALLALPGVSHRLNWKSAFNFFTVAREGVGDETFVQDVFQIPPSHLLRIDMHSDQVSAVQRWWQVPLGATQKISFDDAAEELRRLFLHSVQLHMRSDVPIGVALSGGLDSSAVACAIRHLYPDFPLHAFAYIAGEDPAISEERWIMQAANHVDALLHTTSPTSDFLQSRGDEVFLRLNEPFSSSGLFAQYQVHQLAKEHGVTVLLNGEGGDEVLGGYYGYLDERMRTLLGRGDITKAVSFFRAATAWPGRSGSQTILRILKAWLPAWAEPLGRRLLRRPLFPAWLNSEAIAQHHAGVLLPRSSGVHNCPDIVRATLADALTWAGCPNLLRYGDRCAAAFSLENRVPFLTTSLAEFCLSLPEEYLISMKGETKSVFRMAMHGIVPEALLNRRDKIGFESPEKQWILNAAPWVESILDEAKNSSILRANAVHSLWQDTLAGKCQYSSVIWRILCYLRWKKLLGIQE